MFLAIEFHCTPPDVEGALGPMLEDTCNMIRGIKVLDAIRFGIQLNADNSPHKLGDTIWADAQFRGRSSRDLEWETLADVNESLLDVMEKLVAEHINKPERLANEGLVPCELIESNVTVQGVGHWAEGERKMFVRP